MTTETPDGVGGYIVESEVISHPIFDTGGVFGTIPATGPTTGVDTGGVVGTIPATLVPNGVGAVTDIAVQINAPAGPNNPADLLYEYQPGESAVGEYLGQGLTGVPIQTSAPVLSSDVFNSGNIPFLLGPVYVSNTTGDIIPEYGQAF